MVGKLEGVTDVPIGNLEEVLCRSRAWDHGVEVARLVPDRGGGTVLQPAISVKGFASGCVQTDHFQPLQTVVIYCISILV